MATHDRVAVVGAVAVVAALVTPSGSELGVVDVVPVLDASDRWADAAEATTAAVGTTHHRFAAHDTGVLAGAPGPGARRGVGAVWSEVDVAVVFEAHFPVQDTLQVHRAATAAPEVGTAAARVPHRAAPAPPGDIARARSVHALAGLVPASARRHARCRVHVDRAGEQLQVAELVLGAAGIPVNEQRATV